MRLPRAHRRALRRSAGSRQGFTLAEAAVTIAIVGIALAYSVQAMNGAMVTAAQTQREKIARELALATLGEISAGLWWDDIELSRDGSYAEEGYPEYSFELALGDEEFPGGEEVEYDQYGQRRFDTYADREERERASDDYDEERDEEAIEPFEKVRIRVTFPPLDEFENEVVLERWFPWEQVYGAEDDDEEGLSAQDPNSTSSPGASGAGGGGAQDGGGR